MVFQIESFFDHERKRSSSFPLSHSRTELSPLPNHRIHGKISGRIVTLNGIRLVLPANFALGGYKSAVLTFNNLNSGKNTGSLPND